MLATLVKGTDWSQLTEYLSPVFFQVVPPLKMAKKIKSLMGGYLSTAEFSKALAIIEPALQRSALNVSLASKVTAAKVTIPADEESLKRQGNLVLRMYFWQILNLDVALLDFRRRAFNFGDEGLIWQPSSLFNYWDKEFISSVRAMYVGFYLGKHETMDAALRKLGLFQAKDILLDHFGSNQQNVRFRLADFQATFHEVFVACKNARSELNPDFLALGGMLACLYEHLEQLDLEFDARTAFQEVITL